LKYLIESILSNREFYTVNQKQVIIKRFGLDRKGERTLQETAEEIGLFGRERARQLQNKALRTLRHPRSSSILKHYL